MPAERYFIDSLRPDSAHFSLEGTEFHHAIRVMRTRVGDVVEAVNGQGILARARLEVIEKERAQFAIEELFSEPVPQQRLILVQALPKSHRLEFIVEKGTELGMTELWLFPGDLSEKKELSPNQEARLQAQLIAAMKQCGRLYVPALHIKPALKKWKEFPSGAYFGDVTPTASTFTAALKQGGVPNPVFFFVGPESGFSEQEILHLKNSGVQGVHLHKNVLRTDTAGMVALTIVSSCY